MRRMVDAHSYSEMVANVTTKERAEVQTERFGAFLKDVGTGADIFLLVLSACFVGYYLGKDQSKGGYGFVLALIFGIGCLAVEAILIVSRLYNFDKFSKRRQKEIDKRSGVDVSLLRKAGD